MCAASASCGLAVSCLSPVSSCSFVSTSARYVHVPCACSCFLPSLCALQLAQSLAWVLGARRNRLASCAGFAAPVSVASRFCVFCQRFVHVPPPVCSRALLASFSPGYLSCCVQCPHGDTSPFLLSRAAARCARILLYSPRPPRLFRMRTRRAISLARARRLSLRTVRATHAPAGRWRGGPRRRKSTVRAQHEHPPVRVAVCFE